MNLRRNAALAALALLAATPLDAQAPAGLKTMELGKGPTIVLVSGLGGARLQWMPVTRKLMGSYHVVMVDLPGHGESSMPDPFSLDAAAKLLDDVLVKQKAESTIVVGHAMAGAIAVIAAKQHPEHVRGVVTIDASLKTPFSSIPDQQRKYFLRFIEESSDNYNMFLKQMFTSLGRDTTQGKEIYSKATLVPPATMKSYLQELMYFDLSTSLKDWKTPLLYIASSRAWPDSVTAEQLLKNRGFDAVAGVQPRRVRDSGYLMMSEQADTLAAVLAGFATQAMARK